MRIFLRPWLEMFFIKVHVVVLCNPLTEVSFVFQAKCITQAHGMQLLIVLLKIVHMIANLK